MNNFNFDGFADGDWDEKGDLSWNEFDWQQFLKRQQKEISRFITFYDQHFEEYDRLDKAANRMGWDVQDWSVADPDIADADDDDDDRGDDASSDDFSTDGSGETDFDPYTLHRHPVYVASTGIFAQIRYGWEMIVNRRARQLDSRVTWKFSQVLHESEMNLVMALQSLDMGDYMLAVVHLKWTLRALNDSLAMVPQVAAHGADPEDYAHQLRTRLFDLREICLRVMQDSREEERRGFRSED